MKVEVDNILQKKYPFNFEKIINSIIATVPQEHILGLKKICLIGFCDKQEKSKNSCGLYYGKREGENEPIIIINVTNVFRGIPKFLFYIFPLLPKLFLADTIYHEIAHHYQRLRHGIKKEQWERDAKVYSRKMILKNFRFHLIILKLIFKPVFIISKIKNDLKNLCNLFILY